MKKLALGLATLLFAVSVLAAERPAPPEIKAPTNGEEWSKLSSTEKLSWALGYAQGYQEALDKIDVSSGPNSQCAALAARTERQTSTMGKVSGFELVSSLEKFYSEPANVNIPVPSAVRITLFQMSGKDQATVQELIETARVLGESRRAQK